LDQAKPAKDGFAPPIIHSRVVESCRQKNFFRILNLMSELVTELRKTATLDAVKDRKRHWQVTNFVRGNTFWVD
jgi:hypothetical protein